VAPGGALRDFLGPSGAHGDYSPDFLTWRLTGGRSGTGFGTEEIDPLSPVEVEGATGSSCPARGE